MPKLTTRPARAASVHTTSSNVNSDTVFLAENAGRRRNQATQRDDLDGGHDTLGVTIIETNRPDTIYMWKPGRRRPDGTTEYTPRLISVVAIGENLRNGWKQHCPDCGLDHIDRNGIISSDPNLCPARPPVMLRLCPVCGKRIYDNLTPDSYLSEEDSEDPNVIKDESYTATTPEERTAAQLNLHMWLRHPQQAMMRGLPPLPTALREVVEGARPV